MFSQRKILRGGAVGVLLAGFAATSAPASAVGDACGQPGKPPCPLQRWMRTEVARPLAENRLHELADALERVAKLNPEPAKWQNWSKFARDGAKAAREGRRASAITSCARCHSIYRPEYNVKYRSRSVD